jgi:hypothetical protein
MAPRILEQLGHGWPYGDDGNGGPDLLELLEWSAVPEVGRVTATPSPLFPRVESEADGTAEA